jgi:hypothetical protein
MGGCTNKLEINFLCKLLWNWGLFIDGTLKMNSLGSVWPYLNHRLAIQQNMPEYLTELFVWHISSRTLYSSSVENRLTISRTKTKYGNRKFDTWIAKIWNTLPPALQEAPTISAFKRQLKTRLFKEHYNLYIIFQ